MGEEQFYQHFAISFLIYLNTENALARAADHGGRARSWIVRFLGGQQNERI
jgi:hypothetical protein